LSNRKKKEKDKKPQKKRAFLRIGTATGIFYKNFGKIHRKIKRKVEFSMAQVTCSVCGCTCDETISHTCPECGDCVCDECGALYEGYCKDCFDLVAQSFE